jgi:hypothetical protein
LNPRPLPYQGNALPPKQRRLILTNLVIISKLKIFLQNKSKTTKDWTPKVLLTQIIIFLFFCLNSFSIIIIEKTDIITIIVIRLYPGIKLRETIT